MTRSSDETIAGTNAPIIQNHTTDGKVEVASDDLLVLRRAGSQTFVSAPPLGDVKVKGPLHGKARCHGELGFEGGGTQAVVEHAPSTIGRTASVITN